MTLIDLVSGTMIQIILKPSTSTSCILKNHLITNLIVARYCSKGKEPKASKDTPRAPKETTKTEAIKGAIPYKNLSVGVPKEKWPNERRVALTPAALSFLTKKGITVNVESNAGAEAKFMDQDYVSQGAKITSRNDVFNSNIILKVRQPIDEEVKEFSKGSTLVSFIYPAQNTKLIESLAEKNMTVFAMDW